MAAAAETEPSGTEAWNEGRFHALRETLIRARQRLPFYSERLADPSGAGSVVELLAGAPLLRKVEAIARQGELRLSDAPSWVGRVSTGTTRRGEDYLAVAHDPAELAAAVAADGGPWPRVLQLEGAHRDLEPLLEPNVVRVVWLHHPNVLARLRRMLVDDFEILRADSGPLIKLTLLLEQTGFDFAAVRCRQIGVWGFLSERWRRYLGRRWLAPLVEVYSLSEVRGGAPACAHGDHFHFHPVPIVTEVVDLLTDMPLAAGRGELVLTPLLPYSQAQPLVRYCTGDVVEVVPCARDRRLGFRWLGRRSECVPWTWDPSGSGVLAARDLLDVLDPLPDVARSPDDFEELGLLPRGTTGWPLFRVERLVGARRVELRLHLTLQYLPQVYEVRSATLREYVTGALLARDVELGRAVDPDLAAFEVVLHGPGEDDAGLRAWREHAVDFTRSG